MTVQFVPLKVTTAGAEWGKWSRQYPPNGRGIPFLYVIRADGKMLFGDSGRKSGAELGQFMYQHLSQAGRVFNDQEVSLLSSVVKSAKQSLDEGNSDAAVREISSLSKLGTLGNLASFSSLATEADTMANQLLEQAEAELDEALSKLNDPETAFDGALDIARAREFYGSFPAINERLRVETRKSRGDAAQKLALQQADAVVRALARLNSKKNKGRELAVRDLTKVVEKYPDSSAARFAAGKIEEITGESPATPQVSATDLRTWTDATGGFELKARAVATKDGWVRLEKQDGSQVSVRIDKLSAGDQAILEGFARN